MRTAKILLPILAIALVIALPSANAQTRVTTVTTVDTVRPGDTIRPGEVITRTNASSVQAYLSPGNYVLVTQGVPLRVVSSSRLDWPPPYLAATEKYSSQCSLRPDGSLNGYVAGLPFPLIDPNDPAIATKIMWNYTYRPMFSDDVDIRYPEIATYSPTNDVTPINYLVVGHMAIYNNIGRVEVPPIPTDPDALNSGIASKFAMFPFIEPSSMFGYGMLRFRYIDPYRADDIWMYSREARRVRRVTESSQSDPIASPPTFGAGMGGGRFAGMAVAPTAALANNLDSDSLFGFSANPANFTYRFLGERRMLAMVHAVEGVCPNDDPLSCTQNWEIRRLYVVEADAKPNTNMQIPRRVLYVDSEGWFITASDQYDRDGALWKSLVNFVSYADRSAPGARVAIYPYRRFFQIGTIDANLQDGYVTVASMPGPGASPDSWYINMGAVDQAFFTTGNLEVASSRP
jgi:Protein of unknown function (DUF1329)